jgi:lipoprotein-releasing system permease protein
LLFVLNKERCFGSTMYLLLNGASPLLLHLSISARKQNQIIPPAGHVVAGIAGSAYLAGFKKIFIILYLHFAWRYFRAKKSANAINIIAWVTVGVIAFATACQILVLSVFNGFESLVKSLYSSFYTDLKVIPAKGKTFMLTPKQIASIRQYPEVYSLSMVAEEKALLRNDDVQNSITLKGVDDNYKKVSGVAGKIVAGSYNIGTADSARLVVGYGIQSAAFINVNAAYEPSVVSIILPRKGKLIVADPLQKISEGMATASGVFAIQQEFDVKYAITNIDFVKAQMGYDTDEYTACEIKITDAGLLSKVQAMLQQSLGNAFLVQTKYQQNQSLYTTMQTEKWVIYAILTLILIVAAFNMISALTMLVLEKQKDIGILQSMGATSQMIRKIFLTEGLLLGGIGAAGGMLLALLICVLQLKFKLVKLQGGSFLIDYFPVEMHGADFLLVAASATIIAFVAAWIPAAKAAAQKMELK